MESNAQLLILMGVCIVSVIIVFGALYIVLRNDSIFNDD